MRGWFAFVVFLMVITFGGCESVLINEDFSSDPEDNPLWSVDRYTPDDSRECVYDSANDRYFLVKSPSFDDSCFDNYCDFGLNEDLYAPWTVEYEFRIDSGADDCADGIWVYFSKYDSAGGSSNSYFAVEMDVNKNSGCDPHDGDNAGGVEIGTGGAIALISGTNTGSTSSDSYCNHLAYSNQHIHCKDFDADSGRWDSVKIHYEAGVLDVVYDKNSDGGESKIISYSIDEDFAYAKMHFHGRAGCDTANFMIRDVKVSGSPSCVPKTCEEMGYDECGSFVDCNGDMVDCGSCGDGEVCEGGMCVCEPALTCDSENYDCGSFYDDCNVEQDCGSCDDDNDEKCIDNKCVKVEKSELKCGDVFEKGDYINFTVIDGSGSVKSVDVGGEVYSVDSGKLYNDGNDVYFLHSFDSAGSIPVVVEMEDSSKGVVYSEYRNLIVYDKDNSEPMYYVASCIDDPDGYFVASGSDPVKFNASSTKAIRHPKKPGAGGSKDYHVIDNEKLTFDWRFKSAVTGEEYFRCAGLAGEPCVKGAKGTKINFHRRFPVAGGNVASLTVSIPNKLRH